MRRRVNFGNTLPQYRRFARNAPRYKCAGKCGAQVDRPDTTCFSCTMDEIHGRDTSLDWLDDEPEDAA